MPIRPASTVNNPTSGAGFGKDAPLRSDIPQITMALNLTPVDAAFKAFAHPKTIRAIGEQVRKITFSRVKKHFDYEFFKELDARARANSEGKQKFWHLYEQDRVGRPLHRLVKAQTNEIKGRNTNTGSFELFYVFQRMNAPVVAKSSGGFPSYEREGIPKPRGFRSRIGLGTGVRKRGRKWTKLGKFPDTRDKEAYPWPTQATDAEFGVVRRIESRKLRRPSQRKAGGGQTKPQRRKLAIPVHGRGILFSVERRLDYRKLRSHGAFTKFMEEHGRQAEEKVYSESRRETASFFTKGLNNLVKSGKLDRAGRDKIRTLLTPPTQGVGSQIVGPARGTGGYVPIRVHTATKQEVEAIANEMRSKLERQADEAARGIKHGL